MPDTPSNPTAEATTEPLLVPAGRVAELLSISPRTVRVLDVTERIPAPVRLGRRTLWSVKVLEAWVLAGCPPRHRWEAMNSPATGGKGRGGR